MRAAPAPHKRGDDGTACQNTACATVWARPGRSSSLSVSHRKLVLCGGFVWARRPRDKQKRFSARASVTLTHPALGWLADALGCLGCRQMLEVPEEARLPASRLFRCPKCRAINQTPAAALEGPRSAQWVAQARGDLAGMRRKSLQASTGGEVI